MDEKTLNEIKSQLWDHLQYLIGRIGELSQMRHAVNRWDWLGDQYDFCKSEIAYWKKC